MAEAAVESPPGRFYCHQCSAEITPKIPEYTCPRCNSGFIEELTLVQSSDSVEPSPQAQAQDAAARFAEMWTQALLGSTFAPMDPSGGVTVRQGGGVGMNPGPSSSADGAARPGPSTNHASVRVLRTGRNPYMEGFTFHSLLGGHHMQQIPLLINYFIGRLGGEAMQGIPVNMLHLHGNPADYAWGAGGLDTIITQLLNQLENSGPPPAEKEKIDALPHATISQEQVDGTMQCSVCMEDFTVGETVRRLPCEHHYHDGCIKPWLELHGTCPVCRKDLNGQDTSRTDSTPPFPLAEDGDDDIAANNTNSADAARSSNSSTETNPSLD